MTIAKSPLGSITKILLIATGSSLVIISAIVLTIQQTSDRFLSSLENLFSTKTTQLQTTESALLLKQVQSLQELTTTIYQMETVVPTHADRTWGEDWTIATTKLLYLAQGEVRAGIDLTQLTVEDVEVSPHQIAIALPPAEILDSKIDIHNSRVYHYDRGFLNLGPDVAPQLQTLAQQKTLEKIVTTACSEGILTTANEKAQNAIAQFLAMTNDKEVIVSVSRDRSSSCDASNF